MENKTNDDITEITLISGNNNNSNTNDEEKIENSGSEYENITDEEYFLECARYDEFEEFVHILEKGKVDINYKDSRANTALRKFFKLTFS